MYFSQPHILTDSDSEGGSFPVSSSGEGDFQFPGASLIMSTNLVHVDSHL